MRTINIASSFSNIVMKIILLIVPFFVFISGPLSAKAQQATEYVSPDRRLQAVVMPYDKKDNSYQGIKFEIKKISGEIIAKHLYRSYKGEVKVEKVAWTPDSQYFVISISDAVNPKIFPAFFYDRLFNRFRILPVRAIDPYFEVTDPDTIKIMRLQTCKVQKGVTGPQSLYHTQS
jgi:hypothetical protein